MKYIDIVDCNSMSGIISWGAKKFGREIIRQEKLSRKLSKGWAKEAVTDEGIKNLFPKISEEEIDKKVIGVKREMG